MDLKTFETANSWYSSMHEKGYVVPITLCQAIEVMMKKEKLTFPEAYKILDSKHQITLKNKEFTFKY